MRKEDVEDLIDQAEIGMKNSFGVEKGGRSFGAAVLIEDGTIYSSGVYRSISRTLSLHAEQSALAHAAAHGKHEILAIAIITDDQFSVDSYTYPCGLCRQVLFENSLRSGKNIQIIAANISKQYKVTTIRELMPHPWPKQVS